MKNKKIGIIGIGHLGEAMSVGLAKAGYEVFANNGSQKRTKIKLKKVSIKNVAPSTLREMAKNCSTIVLCIQHSQLAVVGAKLNYLLNEDHVVVSCLAQATLKEVQSVLKHTSSKVAKVMTTLGVGDRKGVSAYQLGNSDDAFLHNSISKLMWAISAKGCVIQLYNEEEMRLFTVLIGCFPGIMAEFLIQLETSANTHGGKSFDLYGTMLTALLRSTADLIELFGSAQLVKNHVMTSGGVTEAILMSMEKNRLAKVVDDGVICGLKKMSGT